MKSLKNSKNSNLCLAHGGSANQKSLLQEHVISKLSRKDLEDKYYKEYEKNILLKRQLNAQEQTIKEKGARIIRISEQLKNRDYVYLLASKCFEESGDFQCENELKPHIENNSNGIKSILGNKSKENKVSFENEKKKSPKVNFTFDIPLHEEDSEETDDQDSIDGVDDKEQDSSNSEDQKPEVINRIDIKSVDDSNQFTNNFKEEHQPVHNIINENKPSNKQTKNQETQTIDTFIEELTTVKDLLTQELAEEHFKVLELKHQVNSMKLSETILNKVDQRLERLQKYQDSNELMPKIITMTNKEIADNASQINFFQEEENPRILELIQINNDMKNKISCMKTEIDVLMEKLTLQESQKLLVTADVHPQPSIRQHRESSSRDVSSPAQVTVKENPRSEDNKSNEIDKISPEPEEATNNSQDKNIADDATYDISKHSDVSSLAVDEYLSDGEIPRNEFNTVTEENSKSTDADTTDQELLKKSNMKRGSDRKAILPPEEAMKILTKEMKECEKLLDIARPYNSSIVKKTEKTAEAEEKPQSPEKEPRLEIPETESIGNENSPDMAQLHLNIFQIQLNETMMGFLDKCMIFISWKFNDCEIIYKPIEVIPIINSQFETVISFHLDDDCKAKISEEGVIIQIHKANKEKEVLAECKINIDKLLSQINEKVFFIPQLLSTNADDAIILGTLKCICQINLNNSKADIFENNEISDDLQSEDEHEKDGVQKESKFSHLPIEDGRKSSSSISSDHVQRNINVIEKSKKFRKKSISENIVDYKTFDLIADVKILDADKSSGQLNSNSGFPDILVVTILSIKLKNSSKILKNKNIHLLYIEYLLLPENGLEVETMSIKKPLNENELAYFNFRKEFHVDREKNYSNRLNLMSNLSFTYNEEENYIPFTLVSEPIEDPLGLEDCQELGWGKLCLAKILNNVPDNNSAEIHLNIYSSDENILIGELGVQIDGIELMRTLSKEVHRNESTSVE